MGNLDSVIELKAKIKAIKPKPSGSYDDTQIQNDIADLQDQIDNISVGGYDNTEIKNRVEALENKPDNDTIYDDTVLTAKIQALEARTEVEVINSNETKEILLFSKLK